MKNRLIAVLVPLWANIRESCGIVLETCIHLVIHVLIDTVFRMKHLLGGVKERLLGIVVRLALVATELVPKV